jgi:uncharacterized DUF497 family protein
MLRFDWDDGNRNHVARHGVSPAEAEQVVLNGAVEIEKQVTDGEERILEIGRTDSGRILAMVTTWREGNVRVITAFDPSKALIKEYIAEEWTKDE